jgi:hypothetical protein
LLYYSASAVVTLYRVVSSTLLLLLFLPCVCKVSFQEFSGPLLTLPYYLYFMLRILYIWYMLRVSAFLYLFVIQFSRFVFASLILYLPYIIAVSCQRLLYYIISVSFCQGVFAFFFIFFFFFLFFFFFFFFLFFFFFFFFPMS